MTQGDSGSCVTASHPLDGSQRTACVGVAERPISPASIPNPDWCGNGVWLVTRVEACAVYDGWLNMTRNGVPSGGVTFTVVDYLYMSTDTPNWKHQAEVDFAAPWGDATGAPMEGNFTCSQFCLRNSYTFPPHAVIAPGDATGEGSFDTTIAATGTSGYATNTFLWSFVTPGYPRSNNVSQNSPGMRCDNAIGGRTIGCVVPSAALGLVFSRTGSYPEFARHVADAQASGLPGDYPSGPPLTRLTDSTLINRNRTTACKRSYQAPPGKSCDEYPFASTYQGAYTGGGNPRTFDWCSITLAGPPSTGSRGYSVCMINDRQNSGAGGVLGGFYSKYRYLAGDPFLIEIVP